MDQVDAYLQSADYEAVAEEIVRQYNSLSPDLSAEQAELDQITTQIHNAMKYIMTGKNFPELDEEVERLRLRKAELEDLIVVAKSKKPIVINPETIVFNLKKQAAMWKENRKSEVVHALVQKIYSNVDGTLTVHIGVVLKDGCGGGI